MKHPTRIELFWLLLGPLILLAQCLMAQDSRAVAPAEAVVEAAPEWLNQAEVLAAIGYPEAAKQQNISGKVMVRVLIDAEGHYVKHVYVTEPDPILVKAVTDHLPEVRFSPAVMAGKAIQTWVTIPFDFKVPEDPPRRAKKR